MTSLLFSGGVLSFMRLPIVALELYLTLFSESILHLKLTLVAMTIRKYVLFQNIKIIWTVTSQSFV